MADKSTANIDSDAAALMLLEQEQLGQELHDRLGPQLTAISMLAASLHDRLQSRSAAETELAAKLLDRIEQAKSEARAFAKGLLPVEYDAEGLMSALLELAEDTAETHGIACRLECDEPVPVEDTFTATRLYRIAKEAVHNAVKHGRPHEVVISLTNDSVLRLQVRDDGCGISGTSKKSGGNGIQIMRQRCALVGGTLEICPGPDGGTLVTCSIEKGGAPWRGEKPREC